MTPERVVLVSGSRTAVGRFGGALADIAAVDLGAAAVRGALAGSGDLSPDHVYLANVVQAGNGQNPARSAAIRGGVRPTVPATTLNDVCLASMTALGLAATQIRGGEIETAVVGGFDSMSRAPHASLLRQPTKLGETAMVDLLVRDGLWCALSDRGMGPIAEESNARLGITRTEQDQLAAESHRRSTAAAASGRFDREIIAEGTLTADEGIRPNTTEVALARLRPVFAEAGTITAGNASQMSDAGAAGVVTSLRAAQREGLRPIVEIVARATVAGPDPSLHTKPAQAAARVLAAHGLTAADVGLWEINEAFAGVVIASMRELRLTGENVNVNGGAIAIGHPLGASGFRTILTLAHEMREQDVEYGVAAMCGGGGQGQAVLLRLAR